MGVPWSGFFRRAVLWRAAGPRSGAIEGLATTALGRFGISFLVASVVFLGPLAEEMLFRGFLLPRLDAQLGAGVALFVTAAVFGLLHPHYGANVAVVGYYGWVMGWARLRTGKLVVPVALHVLVNGVVLAITLLR